MSISVGPVLEAPAASSLQHSGAQQRWRCMICGFVYDEARGLPHEGLAPGTAWADVPESWSCPDCGVRKADFSMMPLGESDW